MAWPLSPLTSYVGGTTPYIKASDLNSFQSAINGVFGGTLSLKSVVVDGTGGAASSPSAGEIHVSRVVADTSQPSAATTNKGQIYKESCPTTKGSFRPGFGTPIRWAFGVHSYTKNGLGDYTVVCKEIPSGGADPQYRSVVHVTPTLDVAFDRCVATKAVDGAGRLEIRILFVNAGFDVDFDLTATVM